MFARVALGVFVLDVFDLDDFDHDEDHEEGDGFHCCINEESRVKRGCVSDL